MKNKQNQQIIRQYKKEISPSFLFRPNLKRAFFKFLEPKFEELEEKHTTLTLQFLYEEIGTPDEMIQSFYNLSNTNEIKKLSIKYAIAQLVCCVCVVVALWATAVAIEVVRTADDVGYATITISVSDPVYITTEDETIEEEETEIETQN